MTSAELSELTAKANQEGVSIPEQFIHGVEAVLELFDKFKEREVYLEINKPSPFGGKPKDAFAKAKFVRLAFAFADHNCNPNPIVKANDQLQQVIDYGEEWEPAIGDKVETDDCLKGVIVDKPREFYYQVKVGGQHSLKRRMQLSLVED
jgi:hypothetical protein